MVFGERKFLRNIQLKHHKVNKDHKVNWEKACEVDKSMGAAVKYRECLQNVTPALLALSPKLKLQKLCCVSNGEGDKPRGSVLDNFFNRRLSISRKIQE
jgi:hypothetical protein